ncbi:MAG: hypothetical protein AB7H93_11620 [Vicinamibacterales bacterium]
MSSRTLAVSHVVAAAVLAVVIAVTATTPARAHKAITSKYLFNEDMFPLFRDHCGRCHVDGGVAPMSLLTYDDAAPWAESLRLELLSEDPPKPWHAFSLTAREFDMILVWANGGAPRGDVAKAPPAVPLRNDWASGPPDLAVKMPTPFLLAGAANEATHDVVLDVSAAAGKSLRAVDLLPGLPAIVRIAELSLKRADGTTQALGTWLPGRADAVALTQPVMVPTGASILVRIGYARTWKYESQDLSDASSVGLYFAGAPSRRPAGAR